MITSRINSESRTTVPQAVRDFLGLCEGDELVYDIRDGRVILTNARMIVQDDPAPDLH